jgi:hypothetical protein
MTFAQDDNNLTTLLSELINNPPRAKISNTRFEDSILISLSFRRNQLCYFYFPAHPPWIEMISIHTNDSSFIEHDASIIDYG